MAITTVNDPRNPRKQITYANGIVSAIYFNEIPMDKRKDYGTDGKSWIPTHRINLVVDGVKVSLGQTDKEKLTAKDSDGNYHDVVKGTEVSIEVTRGDDYKGVPQYSAYTKHLLVTAPAPVQAEPAKAAGNAAPARKADPIELIAGNARNTAAILVRRFGVDFNEGIAYAAQVSHNAKIDYADTDSKLTAFQVGVSVGEAVKIAAELAESMEAMPEYINAYLAEQVPHSLDVVKGIGDTKEYVTPILPSKAGETKPKTKPKAAPKPKKEEVTPSADLSDVDDSDSIPF